MKPAQPITPEEAEKLLPDGPKVHIFLLEGDQLWPMIWPRQKVIDRMTSVGVELAGDSARRASHGLASVGEDTIFIETRRT